MTDGPAMGNPLTTGTRADAVRPHSGLTRRAEHYRAGPPATSRAPLMSRPGPGPTDRLQSRSTVTTREAGFLIPRDASRSLLVQQAQIRRLAQQILEDLVSL